MTSPGDNTELADDQTEEIDMTLEALLGINAELFDILRKVCAIEGNGRILAYATVKKQIDVLFKSLDEVASRNRDINFFCAQLAQETRREVSVTINFVTERIDLLTNFLIYQALSKRIANNRSQYEKLEADLNPDSFITAVNYTVRTSHKFMDSYDKAPNSSEMTGFTGGELTKNQIYQIIDRLYLNILESLNEHTRPWIYDSETNESKDELCRKIANIKSFLQANRPVDKIQCVAESYAA